MTTSHDPAQSKTLIFLHMPKAGGSTMNHLIDWNYDHVVSLATYDRIPAFVALPDDEKRKIDCVKGPIFYGIHRYLPQPCTYITLMRHPVERTISQYYYDFARKRRLGEPIPDWTMEQYLEIAPFHPTYQLRLLVGGETIERVLHDPLPPDAIEIAKKHLADHFAVAGVMEHYDETLLIFKRTLGWTRAFYARQNVGTERKTRGPLSPETIQRVERLCEPETELYFYVRQQIEAQIAQQDESFRRELEQLRRANQRFERFWNLAEPIRDTPLWTWGRRISRALTRRR